MKNKDEKETKKELFALIKDGSVGLLFGMGIMLLLTVLFAVLMASGAIPEDLTVLMSVIASALGAFGGGVLSAIRHKKNGLFSGLAAGIMMLLLFVILRLCLSVSFVPDFKFLSVSASLLIFGILGGITAANIKTKKNNQYRRNVK